MLNPVLVKATNLDDAWFQCLFKLQEEGRTYKIQRGSFEGQLRLELDFILLEISHPWAEPMLPQIPAHLRIPQPCTKEYLEGYMEYLFTDTKKEGETYTYGQYIMPQMDYVLKMLKDTPNTNQACFCIGDPSSIKQSDPPCLRLIDCRVLDNTLHFFVYFRSWDLWNGFPANLAGLQVMKQAMANTLDLKDGKLLAASKGLHIYDYVFELATLRTGRERRRDGDS